MFIIQFYPHGDKGPVKEFFEELRRLGDRKKALARLLADLDILSQEGLKSQRISVRSIEQGLWELRRQFQGVYYRVFFILDQDEIWLLHAIEKKSKKTPPRDLETIRKRMKDRVW